MTPGRRTTRATDGFFNEMDKYLPLSRTAAGRPSAHDFIVMELPAVIEKFATDFESLPEVVPGFGAARMLIAGSILVRGFTVYGVLLDDDSIDLVGIDIEL